MGWRRKSEYMRKGLAAANKEAAVSSRTTHSNLGHFLWPRNGGGTQEKGPSGTERSANEWTKGALLRCADGLWLMGRLCAFGYYPGRAGAKGKSGMDAHKWGF